ncbi:MAG: RES domain-containing protein [Epsilonproteobacteria bacterium]|nr:MAG: RES domain-containing protein [Campylobacterota bacterium]
MPKAYRIVKPKFANTAFDGEGARLFGGRWNSKGVKIVYTSTSASLATLETFVHLGIDARTVSHLLIEIDIPDEIIIKLDPSQLPDYWSVNPTPEACQTIGNRWVASMKSAVLAVPSAIMKIERNYLINPEHPDFKNIIIEKGTSYVFDERMWKNF